MKTPHENETDKISKLKTRLSRLEIELISSTARMHSVIKAHEETNAKLQNANALLHSCNEQLSQRNDDFTNLTTCMQLPAVIVGSDLKIRFFTPAAENVFELSVTDLGRSISNIKLRVNANNLKALISEALQDLAVAGKEVQDEKGRWYELLIRPYRTVENKIDGAVIVLIDIDALKRNQELIEKQMWDLSAVIQTVSMPLLVLNADLRVKMVNESFCKTFRLTAKEMENSFVYEMGEKRCAEPELRKALEGVLGGGGVFSNYVIDHVFEKLGHKVLKLNASRIQTSQLILLAIEDITEQRQRETELEELSLALKDRGQKLQKSNADLEQFAAVASHDLQEPFHIISSFMALLSSGYKDKLEPKAQELIKISSDAAVRAQNLIRSLLDYARFDNSEQNLESVEIKTVMGQVHSDLQGPIAESSADIEVSPMPRIMGDPLHLGRLFQNLISNAVKYRSERPLKIQISARVEQESWLFQITDNGIGFEEKDKVRIFDMFKRLQGKRVSGVGIGLATCRKIVERHGGKIWAESLVDSGSSFYFSIPVRRTDDRLVAASFAGSAESS